MSEDGKYKFLFYFKEDLSFKDEEKENLPMYTFRDHLEPGDFCIWDKRGVKVLHVSENYKKIKIFKNGPWLFQLAGEKLREKYGLQKFYEGSII